ncbi:MAG: FHA domain-containing protein [Planctomycetes bacterium]|nr:FHA domain-containing protein [Planctomycetota bacterium]
MRLTLLGPEGSETALEASGDNVIVGRMAGRGLQIDDPTVSREHARIFCRDGLYQVADLNSSNGTYVNGERVTRCTLANGDILRLGSVELRFEAGGGAAPKGARAAEPAVLERGPVAEVRLEEDPQEQRTVAMAAPLPAPRASAPAQTLRRPAAGASVPSSPRARRSFSFFSSEIGQHSLGRQLLFIALAAAVAYGLFLASQRLAEQVIPEGGLPETEQVESED